MDRFISSSEIHYTWHTLSCWHVIVFCPCFIVLNNLFWQRARIIGSMWIDFQNLFYIRPNRCKTDQKLFSLEIFTSSIILNRPIYGLYTHGPPGAQDNHTRVWSAQMPKCTLSAYLSAPTLKPIIWPKFRGWSGWTSVRNQCLRL